MSPVQGFDAGTDYASAEEVTHFALLPVGRYTVQIEDVIEGPKSKAGNATYRYKCKMLNPPTGEAPVDPTTGDKLKWPDRVFIRMNSSPKTVFMWKTLFKACKKQWTGKQINPNLIVGSRLIVEIRHEMYQNKLRADIAPGGFYAAA